MAVTTPASGFDPKDIAALDPVAVGKRLDDPLLFRRIYVNDQGESTVTIYELR